MSEAFVTRIAVDGFGATAEIQAFEAALRSTAGTEAKLTQSAAERAAALENTTAVQRTAIVAQDQTERSLDRMLARSDALTRELQKLAKMTATYNAAVGAGLGSVAGGAEKLDLAARAIEAQRAKIAEIQAQRAQIAAMTAAPGVAIPTTDPAVAAWDAAVREREADTAMIIADQRREAEEATRAAAEQTQAEQRKIAAWDAAAREREADAAMIIADQKREADEAARAADEQAAAEQRKIAAWDAAVREREADATMIIAAQERETASARQAANENMALKERFDPAYAASRRYSQSLADLETTRKRGLITDEVYIQQQKVLEKQLLNLGGGTRLASYQITNLSYQIQDAATQLAGGGSPFLIMMQQGPQAVDAVGGVGRALRLLASPIGVAIGGLAGIGLLLYAYGSRLAGLQAVDRQIRLMGGGITATRDELDKMARSAADAAGISVVSAREMQAAFAGTGKISATVMPRLIQVSRPLAIATDQDLDTTRQTLAQTFADPAKGAQTLASQYNLLSDWEVKHIARLAEAEDRERAQVELVAAIEARTAGAADRAGTLATSWNTVKTASGNAADYIGRAISHILDGDSIEDQIKMYQDRINGWSTLQAIGLPDPQVEAAKKHLVELQKILDDQKKAAEETARVAGLKDLSRDVASLTASYAGAAGALADTDTKIAAINKLLAAPDAAKYIDDMEATKRAIGGLMALRADLAQAVASGTTVEIARLNQRQAVELRYLGQVGAAVDRRKASETALADAFGTTATAVERAAKAESAAIDQTIQQTRSLMEAVRGLRNEAELMRVPQGLDRDIAAFRHQNAANLPSAPEPYLAAMRAAGERYGVDPALLAAIAARESSFDANQVNPQSGATGLYQFMPETAKAYGLTDRTDPYASIDAAARYVADLLRKSGGDIDAALKSYGGFVTKDAAQYIASVKAYREQFSAAWSAPAAIAERNRAQVGAGADETALNARFAALSATAAASPVDQVRRLAEAARAASDAQQLLKTSGYQVADAFLTQVEAGKSIGEAFTALETAGTKIPQEVYRADAAMRASALIDYTRQTGELTRQLDQQAAAQRRTADATGLGEAAQRRAESANAIAAARANLGDRGAEIQQAAAAREEADRVRALRNDFARGIDQQIQANERLASGYAKSAAAGRDAELLNEAIAETMRELPPQIDAAGRATWDYADAVAATVRNLSARRGLDASSFRLSAEQLGSQQRTELAALDRQRGLIGANDNRMARAEAEERVYEWLERQGKEYATLNADERALVDARLKAADAIADQTQAVTRQRAAYQEYADFTTQVADDLGSALTTAFREGETAAQTFRSLALAVVNDLEQELIKLAITNPLKNWLLGGSSLSLFDVLGAVGGGNAVSNGVSPIQTSVSGALLANGGIMTPSGLVPLNRYASGGIATRPQVAIFGEGKNPEAYVPLPDGRSIPVNLSAPPAAPAPALSTESNMITVAPQMSIQVAGSTGNGAQDDAYARKVGAAVAEHLEASVLKIVANQLRPGGQLYRRSA